MKYLKTFESYNVDIDTQIAEDLLPKFQKIQQENGKFTVEMFEDYMKKRGADSYTIDLVMSSLVNMGFDFDLEEEEDAPLDFELKYKNDI